MKWIARYLASFLQFFEIGCRVDIFSGRHKKKSFAKAPA
jgi:hypothetical protein